MTTRDFITWRLLNLRAFFQARYGRGWYNKVGRQASFGRVQCLLPSHIKTIRTSFDSIDRLEAVAVQLGYRLPLPKLAPASERN
jgi:hypothetical protein